MAEVRLGIYEKALPALDDWPARMAAAAAAKFDFVEIAVDETDERLQRLDWPDRRKAALAAAAREAGLQIYNLILSAHRKYPLGSASAATRQRGLDILARGIDFAVATGIRVIQLAGYYAFYEPRGGDAEARFRDGLARGVEWAGQAGVILAIENMDGEDITSVGQAMRFVEDFDTPWLQVYPDVGNLAGNALDVCAELRRAQGHMVGIHLKDARRGEYRRVPFGTGLVPFTDAFRTLADMHYRGTFLMEMWNDGAADAARTMTEARAWILDRMAEGGLVQAAA